jgi:hypothetical protein
MFPAAFMANTFAMTAVMIALSLGGKPELAADVGIVHGATLALFHAFSANARSIILNPSSGIPPGSVLGLRLMLVLPLGGLSFLLSTQLAGVAALVAFGLVVRRGVEWIAEVSVSEMELHCETTPSAQFLALQTVLTMAVVGWLLADLPFALVVIFGWATSPLWITLTRTLGWPRIGHLADGSWLRFLPHIGSTAIIGMSVYVFRLLILLLVGKTIAGDLYAAFAIGGLLGSVFAQALGPTLVLHEARGGVARFPAWLRAVLWFSLLSGLTLFVMASVRPDQLLWTGKSDLFWMAAGLSLMGGVVMVAAQRVRLRLLQHHAEKDVFGPDVLMNILIVGAVPYLFYLVGTEALAFLYLISSVLAVLFYSSASADRWAETIRSWDVPVRATIALLLLAPIFFQLNGAIFSDPSYNFDTGRLLTRLPIPLSVLACYGGIVLLGGYAWARLSLTTIFLTFTLMLLSSVLLTHEQRGQEQAKLILLIQFVLPMFALVLGQLFGVKDGAKSVLAKMFLYVLVALVPVQLAATWGGGESLLSPSLYLFSVYQHLQYVPLMIVGAYLIALCSLWDVRRYRMVLLMLSAPMGLYVIASASNLAIGLLLAGVVGFSAYETVHGRGTRTVLALGVLVITSSFFYFSIMNNTTTVFAEKYRGMPMVDLAMVDRDARVPQNIKVPQNIAQRIEHWKFYTGGVLESVKSAALGHATLPDRTQHPSAHNYYLDFAYHFGVIALLPLLGLIALTLIGIRRNWGAFLSSPSLLGLAAVVLFLILADNAVKVGMRQPYPGILTFFLWGVLLTELGRRSVDSENPKPA